MLKYSHMKKFKNFLSTKTFPIVMLVIFLAVLLIYPVAKLIRKASSTTIGSYEISGKDFQTEEYELDKTQIMKNPYDLLAEGKQTVKYRNIGVEIPAVTQESLKSLKKDDLANIGLTPGALLSVVSLNLEDPLVINLIFNNKTVTLNFLKRPSVSTILNDHKALKALIDNQKFMNSFFNNIVVKKALESERVISAISKSRLTDYTLRTSAVKYYIARPKTSKKIIDANPHLSQLAKNPYIRKEFKQKESLEKISKQILD